MNRRSGTGTIYLNRGRYRAEIEMLGNRYRKTFATKTEAAIWLKAIQLEFDKEAIKTEMSNFSNEWKMWEPTGNVSKYRAFLDKPVLIIHPNGTVYLPKSAQIVLNTAHCVPVTLGNLVGFMRAEDDKDYHARRVYPNGSAGLWTIQCKGFLYAAGLLPSASIRVFPFERYGNVIAIDADAKPIDTIPYGNGKHNGG